MDQYKNHLKFSTDNHMCTEQENMDIIQSVKNMYVILSNRSAVGSNSVRDNSNTNVS